MSEKLVDISNRIENMRQLDSVVLAMRGIAASRAQQSRELLDPIEAYSGVVARAIAEAVALSPDIDAARPADGEEREVLVLFCAEHGFAGAFSELVLDAAADHIGAAEVMLVGTRGNAIAQERGTRADWSGSMASQVNGVVAVADRVASALYERMSDSGAGRVSVIYPALDEMRRVTVRRISLLPLDTQQFGRAPLTEPPLVSVDAQTLLEQLTAEYVYAELCMAAMHSFAAENNARLEAMSAAGNNIEHKLGELRNTANQVRQEEVTAEIVELAAGSFAARHK